MMDTNTKDDDEYERLLFDRILPPLFEGDAVITNIQKQSFEHFIHHRISTIIEEEPSLHVEMEDGRRILVMFTQVYVDNPSIVDDNRLVKTITPNEARIRDLTYAAPVSVDVVINEYSNGEVRSSKCIHKIPIARIPIMIGTSKCNLYNKTPEEIRAAGECRYDHGGYFIIKGKERVLITQERGTLNHVYVFQQKPTQKYKFSAEIRSTSEENGHSVMVQMRFYAPQSHVRMALPFFQQDVPLSHVLVVFGYGVDDVDRMVRQSLGRTDHIVQILLRTLKREMEIVGSVENAIQELGNVVLPSIPKESRPQYVLQVLHNDMFPHLGITSSSNDKVAFLMFMMRKLVYTLLGLRPEDDRDHLNNKRYETAGYLMSELFRALYKRFVRMIEPQVQKKHDVITIMNRTSAITQGIKTCFATGNWGIPKSNYIRCGVSQILSRLSFNATLSHLRRILIPIGKEGKNSKIRQIHCSQYGFVCPNECFAPDTPVLRWDGRVCRADQVRVDDMLIDDRGRAVRVRKTVSGETKMYRIVPTNPRFQQHTVTWNHILTLRSNVLVVLEGHVETFLVHRWDDQTERVETHRFDSYETAWRFSQSPIATVDMTIDQFRALPPHIQSQMMLFKAPRVEWPSVRVDGEPYDTGRGLVHALKHREAFDDAPTIRIPSTYCVNDVGVRGRVLAGILDALHEEGAVRVEGHWLRVALNASCEWAMFHDMLFVLRSLGLTCHVIMTDPTLPRAQLECRLEEGWRTTILPYSRYWRETACARVDEDRQSFFRLEAMEVDRFVGWQLDGSGRFVAGDFTIYHNTPEGHSSGVVKNFTLLTKVSVRIETSHVQNLLDAFMRGCIQPEYQEDGDTIVILNGRILGFVSDPEAFVSRFRALRSERVFDASISIMHDATLGVVCLWSDDGRILRPLWNLRDFTWSTLCEHMRACGHDWERMVDRNLIVYVDSNEIEFAWVAMRPTDLTSQHHFLEIHPTFMFGVCVNLIPYVDHIQAPRITYQSSMCKQAIGIYASTNAIRCDTIVHELAYPERPIVQTHLSKMMHYDDLPSGNNLIVAIACYGGWNQEDSIIFNKSSIDRGVFRCFTFRTIVTEEKKRSNHSQEMIELPCEPIRNSLYNYNKLDDRGIVKVGTYVGPNDVVVGKTVSTQKKGMAQRTDASVVIRNGEEGYVDRIFESTTPDGYLMVKVKIRYLRIPEIGDKAASRSAQKGTIGMVFRHEDMPFTSQGIVPDMIINPLCIPSRMTINQLLECVAAKGACINGHFVHSTPFSSQSHDILETLTGELHEAGFQRYGHEMLTSGFSGEPIRTEIFIGPTYYQRLKHLVATKIHARDHGSVQSLVRQPLEGRSREGGLRFGEMERDCMISHGVSRFLNERLFDLSDPFQIVVCTNCGTIPNDPRRCYGCEQDDHVQPVNLPYACKLLFQELMAIGIKIHFRLQN